MTKLVQAVVGTLFDGIKAALIFFTKNILKFSCVLYAIGRFKICEISYMATHISLDFKVTFIYLLSLFKRL